MRHLKPTLLDYLHTEKRYGKTSWLFNKNKTESFSYQPNVFTKAQCETIIKIGKNLVLENALIDSQNEATLNENCRKSKTSWLSPENGNEWIFQTLTDSILLLNNNFFNFDLWGLAEGIQFTEYEAPNGKYDPHIDCLFNGLIRKLSISVQLSDENDYEGGNVIINTGNEVSMTRKQGSAIAFPSYVLHGVKPVTKGVRYSLVAWITGPAFK